MTHLRDLKTSKYKVTMFGCFIKKENLPCVRKTHLEQIVLETSKPQFSCGYF